MEALVLNGDTKSALAAVRSLGRRGISVACGAEVWSAMALHSSYSSRRFTYRSPLSDPKGFLADIVAEAEKCAEPPVLFVFSDAAFLTLARNRSVWEGKALMPLARSEDIERAFDKTATIELAQSLGIPVPFTRSIASDADIAPAFSECGSVPVVVKPRHSASWGSGHGASGSVSYAFSESELRQMAGTMFKRFGEYPLVETYIRGGEYGFECLCQDGKILAYSSHRRIRSLNPTGGAAVVKETIEPDARMKKDAEAIIKALSWEGPAMVEFKRDEADGAFRLIEVNGRFWGSLPLAIFAGTDFPYLYYRLARGEAEALSHEPVDAYERGVRSRHFLGDVHHLLKVFFARDRMRSLAYPSRRAALRDFLRMDPGMRYDVFDPRDPVPALMEFINHL